jgi:hypothetical protein
MPFSKFLGTQSPQMSQQAATTTTKIALPTAAALLLPDLTSYSQPLSASPNKNNATTTTADAAAADAAPVDSDEPTLEISPVVERSPERPANKRSTRGGGGGSTPTRSAPKRAAAAMSKKVVDDDDDGAYDDSDIDAPKKSRKRAPVKKRAAADDSSPRRGRPTRLEQDEDPNRQRVPHALSFGTLEAPPVVDVGEAEKQLQALASTVDARQQQLVAWGADSSATDAQIEAAMSACSSELRDVRRICCASELSMPLMALFLRLEQALVNQHVILEVVLGGDAKHALLITKQPHMRVPFKSKPDQVGTIEVELFSSPREANVRYQIDGASESTAKDWLEKHLKNASKALDVNGSARFDSLMFDESTRMEFVTMQFRAKAPGRSAIESGVSNPMVVVTNESQWPGAARKLLWQHTFGDVESIPWPLFANYLSLLVVVSIYGGIETMVRALTPWELRFLHRRWFKSTRVIGRETAIAFWTYFGPVLTALRFKRHIATMWEKGELLGFMTKEETVALLRGQDTGTFCLRFSESVPGAFAVAYVTNDEADPIKHFLVKPTDLGHNRTLPDFLRDKSEFRIMLSLTSIDDPHVPSVAPKDAVLKKYYKATKGAVAQQLRAADGYVNV